jgi:SPP1 gp7 family putative phage head morphogenesis protein
MSEVELQDEILRQSLQLLRLSAGQQAEAEAILAKLTRDLQTLLQSRDLSSATKAELKNLIAEAESAIHPAYAAAGNALDTHALALIVAEKTAHLIEDVLPVTVRLPTAERLASLTKDVLIDGAPSSAWWAKQGEDTAFKFAAQVRQGVINGETQAKIVQRIVGKRGEPGIMDMATRNARTLVHSSVMTAANDARLATFRKNSSIIAGVRWLSTLDSATCLQCGALDGQGWDLQGEKLPGTTIDFQMPPAHFSCRCAASPIPQSLAEFGIPDEITGQRASSLGPLPGATTFADFLKRQTPEFVEKTLGKDRAAMFAAGKITLRDLVSGSGRPLTLDELHAHL